MRWLAYAVLLVLAVELAVTEAFLVAARPYGVAFPVSAVLAVVGNIALGRTGERLMGTAAGAVAPGALWLVVALGLSLPGPAGDTIVPQTWRGGLFLVGGMLALVASRARVGSKGAPSATP